MAQQNTDTVKIYEQKKTFPFWMWLLPLLLALVVGGWLLSKAPRTAASVAGKSLGSISFDTDQAALTPGAKAVLDQASDLMKQKPDMRLRVQGYTDSTGDPAHNVALSNQRSEAVSEYLTGKGIDKARLSLEGFGQSNPIATNATSEGKAENRRVELLDQ